jgi:hypothetical protein
VTDTAENGESPSGRLLPETAGGAFGALIGAWVGTGLTGPFGAATGLAAGSVVGQALFPFWNAGSPESGQNLAVAVESS